MRRARTSVWLLKRHLLVADLAQLTFVVVADDACLHMLDHPLRAGAAMARQLVQIEHGLFQQLGRFVERVVGGAHGKTFQLRLRASNCGKALAKSA